MAGKISEMTAASTLAATDNIEISHDEGGGSYSSLKTSIADIADKVATGTNFNELDTTDKTLVGAINEAAQSGGTTVVANPSEEATDTLTKLQVGEDIYSISGGGSGSGHTILTDSGVELAQKDNLQFKGVYVHNDNNNNKTVVEMTRTLPLREYQLLSQEEKKGVIVVTDDTPDPSYTDVVGTLAAGDTQITLSSSAITSDCTIELYTDNYGVNPIDIVITNGEQVLQHFVAQESELVGTVTASSTFSYYPAWKAFLDSLVNGWVAMDNDSAPYIQYEFPSAVKVDKIRWHLPDANRDSNATKVQYSLDGTTWVDCTLSKNQPCDIEISNSILASYWRLCFTGPYSIYQAPMISQLEFINNNVGAIRLTFPRRSSPLGVKVRVS